MLAPLEYRAYPGYSQPDSPDRIGVTIYVGLRAGCRLITGSGFPILDGGTLRVGCDTKIDMSRDEHDVWSHAESLNRRRHDDSGFYAHRGGSRTGQHIARKLDDLHGVLTKRHIVLRIPQMIGLPQGIEERIHLCDNRRRLRTSLIIAHQRAHTGIFARILADLARRAPDQVAYDVGLRRHPSGEVQRVILSRCVGPAHHLPRVERDGSRERTLAPIRALYSQEDASIALLGADQRVERL